MAHLQGFLMWKRLAFWLLCLAYLFHAPCARAEVKEQAEILSKLSAEAMPKWRKYEEFSHKIQGTIKATTRTGGRGQEDQFTIDFKQNPRCALEMRMSSAAPASVADVSLLNTRYFCELSKKQGSEDWVLKKMHLLADDNLVQGGRSLRDAVFAYSSPHFTLVRTKLSSLFSDNPSFAVKSARYVSMDTRRLVRVDYSFDPSEADRKSNKPARTGWVLLVPEESWSVQESHESFTVPDGIRTQDTVYRSQVERPGFPIVRLGTSTIIFRATNGRVVNKESEWSYDLTVDDNVDDSQFTLTAYGLPEPRLLSKPMPFHVWFLIAAGVSALLMIFFYRLARHRKLSGV